jgi:hypothetical protein
MIAAQEVKACCAAAYGGDAARWLLGDRLHPGGAALTGELAAALDVGPGALVADVACGRGASALELAGDRGCDVVGIDLAAASLEAARSAVAAAGLDERVRFVEGDAARLPLADASVDGVLSECALCTFPDKPAAAREMARVLRRGGRLALSDVTARPDRLPGELRGLLGWVTCVADARPLAEIGALLDDAGLVVLRAEPRDDALGELLDRVEGRLRLARAIGEALPRELRGRLAEGLNLVVSARRAQARGDLGYGIVVACRTA